ncbi:hypothetical protein WKI68_37280 [Streptomyces sp. MS1.HAVA.3]|uniref:Uncharacterized protein n=1 Tax=Streptomyces caledonius TaxID=3134107 RepID=A0ABU8UBU0_9ACTN
MLLATGRMGLAAFADCPQSFRMRSADPPQPSRLAAAREGRILVVVVRRPPAPVGVPVVATAEEAAEEAADRVRDLPLS